MQKLDHSMTCPCRKNFTGLPWPVNLNEKDSIIFIFGDATITLNQTDLKTWVLLTNSMQTLK